MNILNLVMHLPIDKLTNNDLTRLCNAGYIQITEIEDLEDCRGSFDIALFMLRFPSNSRVGGFEYEYINYMYGGTGSTTSQDAIKFGKPFIKAGLKRLCNKNNVACLADLVVRLQREW